MKHATSDQTNLKQSHNMLEKAQKHAKMEPQGGRKTCYFDEPSTQANKIQKGGTTPSYLGPQNQVSTTKIPLEFSSEEAQKRWSKGLKETAQNMDK